VQYENSYRLCYVRRPAGIIVALAGELSWRVHRRLGHRWPPRRSYPVWQPSFFLACLRRGFVRRTKPSRPWKV